MKTKKIVITSVVVFLTIVAIFVISSLVFQNVSFQLVNSPTFDEKAANNNGVSYGYTVSSGYPEWGHIIIIPKTHDGKPVDRIDGFAGKHSTRATKIVIPDSIKVIGAECFRENPYVKEIIIGENVGIEQNVHITCAELIEIGANTAIAANVTITDIHHPLRNSIDKNNYNCRFNNLCNSYKIYLFFFYNKIQCITR